MPSISLVVREDDALLQNRLFNIDTLYGMKSDMYMFTELKEVLAAHNITIDTYDVLPPEKADLAFYYDRLPLGAAENKSVLMISEPPIYVKEPWDTANHAKFKLVFSYNPKLVQTNPEKYRHYYYPIDFEGIVSMPFPTKEQFESRKLANLVNGSIANYKYHHQEGSLLGERYRLIQWFGKTHPSEFDFFGRNIRKRHYGMSFPGLGILKKVLPGTVIMKMSELIQKPIRRVYRGEVAPLEKSKNLYNYRFNFCFENTSNVPGYITEKLFDCFLARTIPIYWGAPNIKEVVPPGCYIDYRQFDGYASLYTFMKSFTWEDASRMFAAQDDFLKTKKASEISSRGFAELVSAELLKIM